jgi:hypothetical protein
VYGGNFLEIEVDDIYMKRLCGLCGEFNNYPNDDFTSSTGVVETDSSSFANSWQFEDPNYP